LAIARYHDGVKLLNLKTMEVTTKISDASYESRLSFSPDGRLLAVIETDGIQLWDVGTHELVADLKQTFGGKKAGLFSPVENLFASGSLDRTVRLWHEEDHDVRSSLVGHATEVEDMVFSPDGRLLASVCREKCIVWDVWTGARRYSLPHRCTTEMHLALSPNGQLLAFQPDDHLIGLWYAETGLPHGTLHITSTCGKMLFSHDSRLFAWIVGNQSISVVDVNDLESRTTSQDGSSVVTATAFSYDGQLLITLFLDDTIRVWDTNHSFRCLSTLRYDGVKTFVMSHNGLRLALLLKDDTVVVIKIPGGEREVTFRNRCPCDALTISPDGQFLATASKGSIELHDLATASPIGRFPSSRYHKTAVAFSCNGQLLAAASFQYTHIWDVRRRRLRNKLRLYHADSVAFSPAGQWIVGSTGGALELWHLPSATCVKSLPIYGLFSPAGQAAPEIERLDFSSDGRLLLTDRGALAVGSSATDLSMPDANALGHFFIRAQWVNYAAKDVLWLPPHLCPPRSALRGNILTLGSTNDVVDYIEFDCSKIPLAGPIATGMQGSYVWEKPDRVGRWKWTMYFLRSSLLF
jgi:WD40 repeat protein